jgi:hypothetical protein
MSWSAPLTVAANDILTAAQYNQSVRDNMLQMAPAKATGPGNWFSVSATNEISERMINSSVVTTSEQTSSTSYVDLSTVGPSVTVTCKYALVFMNVRMRNVNGDGRGAYVSLACSGASTFSANDNWMISSAGIKNDNPVRVGGSFGFTVSSAGTNTFTMKYKCQAGYTPAQFEQRELVVISF